MCVRDLVLSSPVVATSPKVITESLKNTAGEGSSQYAVIEAPNFSHKNCSNGQLFWK